MNTGLQVLVANVPTMVCAIAGGLLVDRGHPWFATAFIALAFLVAHSAQAKDAA